MHRYFSLILLAFAIPSCFLGGYQNPLIREIERFGYSDTKGILPTPIAPGDVLYIPKTPTLHATSYLVSSGVEADIQRLELAELSFASLPINGKEFQELFGYKLGHLLFDGDLRTRLRVELDLEVHRVELAKLRDQLRIWTHKQPPGWKQRNLYVVTETLVTTRLIISIDDDSTDPTPLNRALLTDSGFRVSLSADSKTTITLSPNGPGWAIGYKTLQLEMHGPSATNDDGAPR